MADFAEAAIECREPEFCGARCLPDLCHGPSSCQPLGEASALDPISHYLGGLTTVLGRYNEAEAYYARPTRAMCEDMGAKFFTARTDLTMGKECCTQRGAARRHRGGSQRLLTKAHSAAVANGYGNVERHAAAAPQALS